MARTVFLVMAAFFLGLAVASVFSAIGLAHGKELQEWSSPSDYVSEDQILVFSDHIRINVLNAEWATFTDTNSMDPVLDTGANALQYIPQSVEDISVGDIISYRPLEEEQRIIHRVVFKGEDEEGTYFITKGDNNPVSDPGKVRFEQIERVVFGILY